MCCFDNLVAFKAPLKGDCELISYFLAYLFELNIYKIVSNLL